MKFYFGILTTFFAFNVIEGVLPPNIQVCRRNDPHISDCIVRATAALTPRLVLGDLGGGFAVPTIEPFFIKEISFGEESGLKVQLSDLYIRGASKLVVDKLRANARDLKFDVLVSLPQIDVKGKYKMIFDIFGARSKSDGDYLTQFIDAKLRVSMQGRRYLKNGLEYVQFEPFRIKFNSGTVGQLRISNLFGGNKALSDIVHSLLSKNSDFVLKNVYPQLEASLSRTLTSIANKVVEKATYDELFPL